MTSGSITNQIAPNGAKALGGVYGQSCRGLPGELVEFFQLRVSQINNCAYCLDMHTRDLIKKGVKVEKLALVQAWKEGGSLFSETERAALRPACRIAPTKPRDVFDEKQLVNLTIAISLMNSYNRMAISSRNIPRAVLEN